MVSNYSNDYKTLTSTEKKALEICGKFQKLTKVLGIDLTSNIRENSKDLVILYKMRSIMDELAKILPKHEVIDKRNNKTIGELYDNEYVGNVMLATNIEINSRIRHTEWHIQKISCSKLIL